jgi:hypothetical protein
VIAAIGRTEDVAFSPHGRLVAIAEYTQNRIYVFSAEIDPAGVIPRVALSACLTIESAALREPHGLTFLDDQHLLVCNRAGDVCVFRVPAADRVVSRVTLTPAAVIKGTGWLTAKVKSPGSAAAHRLRDGRYRVLVCNNHWNFVSSHVLELTGRVRIANGAHMNGAAIRIPDGISISADGAWFAISNHVDGEVLVFRNDADLGTIGEPAAVLGGMVCPHGLHFLGSDTLIVADAASPFLHAYHRRGNEWSGRLECDRAIRMMDDAMFFDGRYDAREGGIKGLVADPSARILATTHRLDPIAFYDLERLLECSDAMPVQLRAELCKERDQSFATGVRSRLAQRWTLGKRIRQALRAPRRRWDRFRSSLDEARNLAPLAFRNWFSNQSLLDASGPPVSITTHGNRVHRVHYAIESIASATLKPSRIILWVSERESFEHLPPQLRRLMARGLEVRLCEELGPHTKYFPYLELTDRSDGPLVTADDDVIYPPFWLAKLAAAHAAAPDRIHCHRARRIGFSGSELAPYATWKLVEDRFPSHLNFITGVGGAIYPPAFLQFLAQAGRGFEQCCPRSDDVWLTVNAIRAGIPVGQVRNRPFGLWSIPGTQDQRLFDENVRNGGNQIQLRRTFTQEDVAILRALQSVRNS